MRKTPFLLALPFCAALLLPSCGKEPLKQENVATVNGSSVPLNEFRKEASLYAEMYPEAAAGPDSDEAAERVLENMILKKLMIQEASKMGLSEDEQFLDTIKMFWEQTLIKRLVDAKASEWSEKLVVSDEEAVAHYTRMRQKVTLLVVEARGEEEAKGMAERLAAGERPKEADQLGPLLIENITLSNPLCAAFDLSTGSTGVFKAEDGYLAVKVLKKESMVAPPFSTISAEIKSALLERKKEQTLNDWLAGVRKSASVEINRDALKRAEDE